MDRALDYLGELEREDARIAGEMSALDELASRVAALQLRAQELSDFLEQLPREQFRLREEAEQAERETTEAESAQDQARTELAAAEEAGDEERLASARRFDLRTRDMLAVAERKRERARESERELDRSAAEVEGEAPELVLRAEQLNRQLSGRARMSDGLAESSLTSLADVARWGRQAQAAILVARSGLATERDSIVRQANEIGSSVLGESIGAASAATVARRVESASGRAG